MRLWQAGFAVMCPHLNSGNLAPKFVLEEDLMKGSLRLLEVCDFAVVTGNYLESGGSKNEIKFCIENNKRLYYKVDTAIIDEIDI